MIAVGTWNLENLYLPGGDFGPSTPEAYERKLAALTATIERLDVEVLAVQEVGDPPALAELVDRLDGAWSSALSTAPDSRGIRVGFISRLPIERTRQVIAFPAPLDPVQVQDDGATAAAMGRGALHVRVQTASGELDLLTAHLKSKLLSYPGGRFAPRTEHERARYGAYALYRRAAESVVVRNYANRLLASADPRPLVALGDFNDGLQAATTQLLYGPPGSQFDQPGFGRPDKGDAWRLLNVAPRIPEARRFSRMFAGQRELIDHILISFPLIGRLESADADVDGIEPIGPDPTVRRDEPASDHAAVVARIAD